jgi:hypothetical protein
MSEKKELTRAEQVRLAPRERYLEAGGTRRQGGDASGAAGHIPRTKQTCGSAEAQAGPQYAAPVPGRPALPADDAPSAFHVRVWDARPFLLLLLVFARHAIYLRTTFRSSV